MKSIRQYISQSLGLDSPPHCTLYKLLLYEPGSFFKPHRDTEKEDKMFGTLVIQLPSKYEGGQLVVQHKLEAKLFDFSHNPFDMVFTAFYCDCQHEVKPVTSGYRLCLVYNLVYEGEGPLPVATDLEAQRTMMMEILRRWRINRMKEPLKAVFLLDHQYTENSLRFAKLKNTDHLKANLIREACMAVGFRVFLAKLTLKQTGFAEDEQTFIPDLGETNSISLQFFIDARDQEEKISRLPVFGDEFDVVAMKRQKPDEQEFSEATGNEGATMERWYYRAVVVLWPVENDQLVIHEGMLKTLQHWTDEVVKSRFQKKELMANCIYMANWFLRHKDDFERMPLADIGKIFLKLHELESVKNFLKGGMLFYFKNNDQNKLTASDSLFLNACEQFGFQAMQEEVENIFRKREINGPIELLAELQFISFPNANKTPNPIQPEIYNYYLNRLITELDQHSFHDMNQKSVQRIVQLAEHMTDAILPTLFM
mmetsp:Transcript_22770/g.31712  ORF Transcript_22770/g.31712 Transcript_22770/m.31712 type:complete len:482 (+) Transcript_22770:74-1519(+)